MKRVLSTILILSVLILSGCSGEKNITKSGFYFDTVVDITIYDGDREEAIQKVMELCDHYDRLFDKNDPGSEIYAINHAGGKPVEVSPDTAELIRLGLEYSALSGGVFDITCGAVTSLWDFSASEPRLPDEQALAAALSTVDYTAAVVEGCTVTVPDGTMLDLGGIAKGYIADRIVALLDELGVSRAMINLGGNVYAKGTAESGDPWRIGVQSPFDSSQYSCVLSISDHSAVTSGTYQRRFVLDGEEYHHIIGMDTGMPKTTDLVSVTVVSSSSVSCDALSTICMLLGYNDARALIDELADTEAVFVLTDGTVINTAEK